MRYMKRRKDQGGSKKAGKNFRQRTLNALFRRAKGGPTNAQLDDEVNAEIAARRVAIERGEL